MSRGWRSKKACDAIYKDELKMGRLMNGGIQEYTRTGRGQWDGLEGEAAHCTDWHQAIPATRWRRRTGSCHQSSVHTTLGLMLLWLSKRTADTEVTHTSRGRWCHCPYYLHHTLLLTWKTDWKYVFEMPSKWHGYWKYEHRTSFNIQGSQRVWPLGSCHGKYLMY